ncbi:hypothetical protein C8J57DRAFT_1466332 [Mycena rebaudengoi]|nr:hypothetical protein C8J57DRAFT_1466332 [Mycena rebaudengoi]
MTTASNANSFVAASPGGSFLASVEGKPCLHLLPTLTSDVIPLPQILDGAVYNISGCTYNVTRGAGYTGRGAGGADGNGTRIAPDLPLNTPAYLAACSGVSNTMLGKILPPVMSARANNPHTDSVRAKLLTGDWLWPALWLCPWTTPADSRFLLGGFVLRDVRSDPPVRWMGCETETDTFSFGEINIMEARGNGPSYASFFLSLSFFARLFWGAVMAPMLDAAVVLPMWHLRHHCLRGMSAARAMLALSWVGDAPRGSGFFLVTLSFLPPSSPNSSTNKPLPPHRGVNNRTDIGSPLSSSSTSSRVSRGTMSSAFTSLSSADSTTRGTNRLADENTDAEAEGQTSQHKPTKLVTVPARPIRAPPSRAAKLTRSCSL